MCGVSIIAEAGVNHNGSVDLARRLIDEARKAGADVVKFQSFRSTRLVSNRAPKADYQKRTVGGDDGQLGMLKRLELKADDFVALKRHADDVGIEFMSTPFDEESLAMLVDIGVQRIKLGSGDITNAPLLRAVARTKLPVILSTGMCLLGDVEAALGALAGTYLGDEKLATYHALSSAHDVLRARVSILHCTTEYPAPVEQTNLHAMATMKSAFDLTIGYSDHTEGIAVSLAAIALGAEILEKHFTLDRAMEGPDHAASIDPAQLSELVRGTRAIERALGSSMKRPGSAELRNLSIARRSVVAAMPIARGTVITAAMLDVKRPATGISPMRIDELIGRKASRDYEVDDPIIFD